MQILVLLPTINIRFKQRSKSSIEYEVSKHHIFIMDILTCSREFREVILNEYPGLERHPKDPIAKGDWRHFVSMLFADSHNNIYIGQLQIARDYQMWKELEGKNLIAIEVINRFRKKVLYYEVKEYDYVVHRARTATIKFPQHIIDARDKLLLESSEKRHEVFICSGKTFNRRVISNLRIEDLERMPQLQGAIMPPICKKFQDYLNDLPPQIFSKMLSHTEEALEYINRKHLDGTYVLSEEQRYDYSLYLFSIEERPQPLYVGSRSRNTVRLFELHMGLQGIQSDIRRILTQDWIEMDLQNAHLAIVAKVWDIPEVKEYLASGKSIWESLLPHMGIALDDKEAKGTTKRFLYGCVYGMSINTLKNGLISTFNEEVYEAFISHPVIKAILKARTKHIKTIKDRGGVITYLGEHIHVIKFKNEEDKWEDNLLTILSQEASEYEMLLLEPILDLAISSKDFHLTLYQFDGVSIYIRDKSKKDYILKRIKKAVDKRAKELDILTQVIIK